MAELKNDTPIIDLGGEKPKMKEPFKFEYTMPSLDWYETIHVEIKPDDYYYFELVRRYGSDDWWLIGKNPPAANAKDYRWTEKDIGRICVRDIARFVEWARLEYGGSKLVGISAISGAFDILREVEKLLEGVNKWLT